MSHKTAEAVALVELYTRAWSFLVRASNGSLTPTVAQEPLVRLYWWVCDPQRVAEEVPCCEGLLSYLTARHELERRPTAGEPAPAEPATAWVLKCAYSFYLSAINFVFRRVTLAVGELLLQSPALKARWLARDTASLDRARVFAVHLSDWLGLAKHAFQQVEPFLDSWGLEVCVTVLSRLWCLLEFSLFAALPDAQPYVGAETSKDAVVLKPVLSQARTDLAALAQAKRALLLELLGTDAWGWWPWLTWAKSWRCSKATAIPPLTHTGVPPPLLAAGSVPCCLVVGPALRGTPNPWH
eukprot:g76020.t1